MSPITTHVIDTSLGRPAKGMIVVLEKEESSMFIEVARGTTNHDGRIADWWKPETLMCGPYQIRFDTARYFLENECLDFFYREVKIHFEVTDSASHYHIPLLLSPFGYSTYRGS